jgi:hypothetical protein
MNTWLPLIALVLFVLCRRRKRRCRLRRPRAQSCESLRAETTALATDLPVPALASSAPPPPVGIELEAAGTEVLEEDRPAPSQSMTVADLAFEYARAVVGLTNVSEERKDEVLECLSQRIVPLVGSLSTDDLDDSLRVNVARILDGETEEGATRLVLIWWDFVRWGRIYLWLRRRRPSRENI